MMVPRPPPQSSVPPLIPEFYAGREVFITGATGFMGKVLVERLLWTCPEISKLHLLMRSRKDDAPEDRLKLLKQSKIFDVIKENCPQRLDKLSVVPGDITKNKFGLNKEAVQQLNQVSVVFHSAATIKFDESLDVAMEQNVKAVLRLMDICDHLPLMQVLVYVSTAYSNADVSSIEERVYPPPMSLHQLQILVDNLPTNLLREVTPTLISPKPNTYTFTKAMAEIAVAERAPAAKYATAIFRPSIVVSSLQNPFPGWIENFNGPSGAIVTGGKGVMHVARCIESKRVDMMPVDIAIDTLIAVGWETGVDDLRETRVYNCCSHDNPTTWKDFNRRMESGVLKYPLDSPLWYPFPIITENRTIVKLWQFALLVAPFYTMDFLCRIFGIKMRKSFRTISDHIQAAGETVTYFMVHEWNFTTDNIQRLRKRLAPTDSAIFNMDVSTINWDDHCINFVKGVRRYLLNEKDEDIDKAHRRIRLLYILHRSVQAVIAYFIYRLVVHMGSAIYRTIANYV